jgi:hypothetical protein
MNTQTFDNRQLYNQQKTEANIPLYNEHTNSCQQTAVQPTQTDANTDVQPTHKKFANT